MKRSFRTFLAILLALSMMLGTSAGLAFADDWDDWEDQYDWNYEDDNNDDEPYEDLTVELNRGSIDIGVGGTAVLMAAVRGGTGRYTYSWVSSDPGVVSVYGNDTNADLYAVGIGRATIKLTVNDGQDRVMKTCQIVVTQNGGTARYDLSLSVTAGQGTDMDSASRQMTTVFEQQLGVRPSSSATIQFDRVDSKCGRLCMQNGTPIYAGIRYDFSTFGYMMIFDATAEGQFITNYTVVDGNFVLTGRLTITVKGGARSISSVTMNRKSFTMDTYSTYTISVSIQPNNASYSVEWESDDPALVTADSDRNIVSVHSKGRTGSTYITAIVTDLTNGQVYRRTCIATVEKGHSSPDPKSDSYNPGLAITYGSDYYGTGISDSIYNEFRNRYGVSLAGNAKVTFSNMNTTYGTLETITGYVVKSGANYTFSDLREMFFSPTKPGTWTSGYKVTYSGKTLSGTISININGSTLSVTLSQSSLKMSTYSSQYLYATITPNGSYKTSWSTDEPGIVSVSGNGSAATISTFGRTGTARIRLVVTDNSGIQVVKTCTVTVTNAGGSTSYSPSMSTYIGNTTAGTTIYDSLKNQYRNVYGSELPDSADITFSSTGDRRVAIKKLSNGNEIKMNTAYTMSQYKGMYTDPVSTGTFVTPYTINYKGNMLTGNISVDINPALVNVGIPLTGTAPYTFRQLIDGQSGSGRLCGAINGALNTAASANWNHIKITTSASSAGTLYLNSGMTAITPATVITPAMMEDLYFVPIQPGTYVAQITVCNDSGSTVAAGSLYITVPGNGDPNKAGLKVQPTTQTILVNGRKVDPEAYNINGMNYFKLRAIAYLLDNTSSQFSVGYDYATRAISIVTGAPYEELGTEMEKGPDMSSTCVYSTIQVYVNGCAMNLTSYNIGGSTYFQLSELGNVLGFNVGYDAPTRTVMINSR